MGGFNKDRSKIWILFLILGILYVSQCWSPSSYAVMLRQLGVKDVGLVWGKPRPIRSDEWAVVTPLIQATVRNDFQRINKASYYHEDLRINYGLPLRDWGLVFKPTMWGYFIVDAAHAYSLHWYAIFALFLIGHLLLFQRLGLGGVEAGLLSCALYFTGYTQFWWNEKGPIFALFPWVVLALLARLSWGVRLALFYWLAVSWLVTNFYPPVFLSLAFVAGVMLMAFGRDWLRPGRAMALLLTTACAGGTAAWYLKDYLRHTAATVYPGHRLTGGGAVPSFEWWGQWFPFNGFDWRYESVMGQNICEVGVVGAAFALMYVCFMDHRQARVVLATPGPERRQLFVLSCGLVLMYAWMLLPLPSWAGSVLLWNHVQPERMEYAAGLLMLFITMLLGRWSGLVVTAPRMAVYLAIVILGWMWFKALDQGAFVTPGAMVKRSNDLLVLPVLLICLIVGRRMSLAPPTVLAGASVLTSALMLFAFNPIQSARPIFERHDTPVVRAIEAERAADGTLAMSGFAGAVLNGLGYASVSHVTAVPALDVWRGRYPDLPEAQFMNIFNRYSHIRLSENERPASPSPDAVDVPLRDFWPHRVEIPSIRAETTPTWLGQGQRVTGRVELERDGTFDAVQVSIGTGEGSADGVLHLRICDTASHVCASGQRDLREAADNAYFPLPLDRPMTLPAGPAVLDYALWTEHARTPVALITQPAQGTATRSLELDGVPLGVAVRFRIEVRPKPS